MRHVVIAALVVVVVNAQLCWWVIFFLQQNRLRLDLEREQLTRSCQQARNGLQAQLDQARADLAEWLAAGQTETDRSKLPQAFVRLREELTASCSVGWRDDGRRLELGMLDDGRCVVALAERSWRQSLLVVPRDVELAPADAAGAVPDYARVELPPPYSDFVVRPLQALWQQSLDGYLGRIKMVVAEASFFALLLFVVIGLLWKTVRREVELERQHRNFLSAITHELKSPLAAMRLSLETVLRGRADQSASVRFLENALQDTERLQSLVQKVLEVTRFGRQDGHLQLRRVCLNDLLEESLYTFSRRATAAGARVETELEPNVWVDLDAEAFAIVISNLLENAIKYGGTIPRVLMSLRVEDEQAVIEVCDNGKGIPEEEVPFVFNRFFRCGDEMTRTAEGTGLGLYLVRQIVTAHHGHVSVAATGSEGTTFRVVLPNAEVWEDGV